MPDEALPLIASGRDADVFDLGGGRVLRRYRHGRSADRERAIMIHVAAHGVTVPRVHGGDGPDLVLERIDGPTMLAALREQSVAVPDAAVIMADLHARLHRVPPVGEGPAIVHLDLHPDNVILGATGAVLIDWSTAREGEADLDLAVSALILAEATFLEPTAADLLRAFVATAAGDPLRLLPSAVARRRANPTLSALEKSRLDDAAALVAEAR